MFRTLRDGVGNLRLPTPVLLAVIGGLSWGVYKSNYIQDALDKAKDYIRPLK